jgi:hypothetical protein
VQKRLCKQHKAQRALCEIRDALLDDRDRHLTYTFVALIVSGRFFVFGRKPMHDERTGVNRRLWYETIRRRDAEETREERCHAKEREIVMEPSRLAERKLGPLRDQ